MKKLLLLALVAALCGCESKKIPKERTKTENDYQVDLLFIKDGCKVYKFYDNMRAIYFTNCPNSSIQYNTGGKSNQIIKVDTN